MRRPLERDEMLKIGSSLEDYHKIFYTFWEMSDAVFTDEVPTAAVRFFHDRKPELMIGEEFWNNLTHREKLFVVCHECLHVILDHGDRDGHDVDGATPDLVNRAQDITINEMIVDLFKYDRDDLRDWKNYCWIDTCFSCPAMVKRNETFTYYLKLLIEELKKNPQTQLPDLFDVHPTFKKPQTNEQKAGSGSSGSSSQNNRSGSSGSSSKPGKSSGGRGDKKDDVNGSIGGGETQEDGDKIGGGAGGEERGEKKETPDDQKQDNSLSEEEKKARQEFAGQLAEDLNPHEIEEMLNASPDCGAGTGMGDLLATISKKTDIKVNFMKMVKKIKRSRIKIVKGDHDTFAQESRRFNSLLDDRRISLPGKGEINMPDRDKILCALFMDVSGSCIYHYKTFEKVFLAFDQERNLFECRLFIFDTSVTEIEPGDTVRMGGGTSFNIIEKQCRELQSEYGKYPDAVVVITDGEGDTVEPLAPNRWIWLLVDNGSKRLIPNKSKVFKIKDVVF